MATSKRKGRNSLQEPVSSVGVQALEKKSKTINFINKQMKVVATLLENGKLHDGIHKLEQAVKHAKTMAPKFQQLPLGL